MLIDKSAEPEIPLSLQNSLEILQRNDKKLMKRFRQIQNKTNPMNQVSISKNRFMDPIMD